jgi:hypothetical protein
MELIQQLLFALIVAAPAAYAGYRHGHYRASQLRERDLRRRMKAEIVEFCLRHEQVRLSDVLRMIDEAPLTPAAEAPPAAGAPPESGQDRVIAVTRNQDLAAVVRAFFWGK